MSGKTSIEWTDAVWNPTTGCNKVSPGCINCYAEVFDRRFQKDGPFLSWALPASRGGRGVTLHPERLDQPLRWKKPRRIFVNSMSDLFHEDIPDGFIYRVWLVMAQTPWHTYQILTKRPERMLDFVHRWSDLEGEPLEPQLVRGPEETRKHHPSGRGQLFAAYLDDLLRQVGGTLPPHAAWPTFDWMGGHRWWPTYPLPNVWLGVSAESQYWADRRIPILAEIPAAVRFVSYEPALGPVDLGEWLNTQICTCFSLDLGHDWDCGARPLHWVIAGGESGPKARPAHCNWIRSLRGQCEDAGVPFFFKQWGEWFPRSQWEASPELILPDDTYTALARNDPKLRRLDDGSGVVEPMHRVGKGKAGALLDGREWREMLEA